MSRSRLDWLEKTYVYAALGATPSLPHAQALLAGKGIVVNERQLEGCRQRGGHCVEKALQHQLPQRLYGVVNFELQGRLEKLAENIEAQLSRTTWENRTDVDLVDKYLKLMELLVSVSSDEKHESGEEEQGVAGEASTEAEPGLEEILRRFEEANDQETIRDAVRQAAAATGSDFPEPGEGG